MVLLFEFSAFGIIFHGVKSVLFIGNLTHSPWTGHNYNRIHVPCLACDFICFKGHLTCAQGKSFFKTIPEGALFSQTGGRTTQKHHIKLTWKFEWNNCLMCYLPALPSFLTLQSLKFSQNLSQPKWSLANSQEKEKGIKKKGGVKGKVKVMRADF